MLSQRLVIQEVTLKLQLGPRGVWLNLLSFSLVLLFNGKICCPALVTWQQLDDLSGLGN